MRKLRYVLPLAVIALCLTPMGAVIWSSWFAKTHGCTLHEGFANPCVVNGEDWGETLYGAYGSGWFMLVTLPVAGLAGAVMLVVAFYDLLRYLRHHS